MVTLPGPFQVLMRVPVPWVFVLMYLTGAALERIRPLGRRLMTMTHVEIAGAVLFTIGAVIAGSGLTIFHKARTTTTPGERSSMLVTWGPYRFTRNPMYVGLVLAYIGEAGILRHVWPLVLLPLVLVYLNWIVIPVEEARLNEAFPEAYARYRRLVRRWI
jgi:protein-S-isoprenylcysteine O-methyltransferase Ste14